MEETRLQLFLKGRFQQLLMFFIRMIEVFLSSIIPSLIGVLLIFLNPNERIWGISSVLSMLGFLGINCNFNLKNVISKGVNKKNYYIVNGLVHTIYAVVSIFSCKLLGYLVYSMVFANLRFFELFGLRTMQSVYASNAFILATIFIFGFFAYRNIEFLQKVFKLDTVEDSEMERYYSDKEATQNNENVNILSLEEMNENIINEITEAHEEYKKNYEKTPDSLWNKFKKGRGEKIEYATEADIENDVKEVIAAIENEEENPNEDYPAESLWNDKIYNGGEKITSYAEEAPTIVRKKRKIKTISDVISDVEFSLKSLNHLLSTGRNYQKNELVLRQIQQTSEMGENVNKEYEAETLWESKFYKGQDEDILPEKVLDFDETPEQRENTGLENYESDKLWDVVPDSPLSKEDALKEALLAFINPNEDYDSEELFNVDESRKYSIESDMNEELPILNLNADYDSDSLWSSELKQGKHDKQ